MTEQSAEMEKLFAKEELLSEREVFDVLEYARSLDASLYPGILSPFLLNQRMQDITLNNVQATESTLNEALKYPKQSEEELQEFSQDFEITSQPYKRLLSYLGNMLSFDVTYNCTNIKKVSEYKKPAYQKDVDVIKEFMDRFDYRKEFTTVVKQLLRNEAFFSCPRFDFKDKWILQELPASPEYTMITGRWGYGFLFSLNMYWFWQAGVDVNLYPDFFKGILNKLRKEDGGMDRYKPSLSPLLRAGSNYSYWQDLPVEIAWCWKFNPALVTRVPYFSGMFLDLIQQPLMRALQKSINMAAAAKVLVGQIGMLKDPAIAQGNQFNIGADRLGKFLSIIKAAVGDSLKVAALPLEEVRGVEFSGDNDMYSSSLKTALGSSGNNTNLLFANDLKPNAIETQLSLNSDEQLMTALYPQFNAFMNYHINRRTSKYKFDFQFEGTKFFNNRQERLDKQIELSSFGMVLPQKMAAAIGMNPFEFQRQMDEARELGFVDDLTPIVSGFQQGVEDANSTGGRPRKKTGDLSESGEGNRSTGANVNKGGKI